MLYLPKQSPKKSLLMKNISRNIACYLAVLSSAEKHGVTNAAIKCRAYRRSIYRLCRRYDDTPLTVFSAFPQPRLCLP